MRWVRVVVANIGGAALASRARPEGAPRRHANERWEGGGGSAKETPRRLAEGGVAVRLPRARVRRRHVPCHSRASAQARARRGVLFYAAFFALKRAHATPMPAPARFASYAH